MFFRRDLMKNWPGDHILLYHVVGQQTLIDPQWFAGHSDDTVPALKEPGVWWGLSGTARATEYRGGSI